LLHSSVHVNLTNSNHPTRCRANDRDRHALYYKYMDLAQELLVVPGVLGCVTALSAEDAKVNFLRGGLRLNIGKSGSRRREYRCC
jgi:hypothetical protein